MEEFLNHFADTLQQINVQVPGYKSKSGNLYQAGIGPYTEDGIVDLTIEYMATTTNLENFLTRPNMQKKRNLGLENYLGLNGNMATPDLIYNNNIIEFKICRPLRDNGQREDTWFKKVFEPNPASYSTFLDVYKLCRFRDVFDFDKKWNGWVVIIGFERQKESEYQLDTFFPNLYKYISDTVVNQPYQEFISLTRDLGNRHPFHQVLKLYAFRY
jgi:hypothetical protein